ncbi:MULTISPECIES: hypothetical protein [unclassified Bradyrhizobium]|uniref:hypothetical protein n=1 Tax=unclassified Bradyrhizobium TaxID=2631580 RepID=UPI0029170BBC|nr:MULTISPECIES: hypothetical protein [unclassified Bradyrhizobium]
MRRIKGVDVVFRSAVDPNFRGKKKAFDAKQFLRLAATSNGFETSLVWQYLAPSLYEVHAFGARLATSLNQSDNGKRCVYCGFYALSVDDVRSLVGAENLDEVCAADVTHKVENGEIAHAALEVVVSAKRPDTRTALVDRLWNSITGPVRCVLSSDEDLSPHPCELLSAPPKGKYLDRRSFPRQAFDVMAFRLYRAPKARRELFDGEAN